MKTLHFSIDIHAPKEKVWNTMLGAETYPQWAALFNPGSHYEGTGDWSKGSRMVFLGPDPETGKEGGMVSLVTENRPYEYLALEHQGMVQDGTDAVSTENASAGSIRHLNTTRSTIKTVSQSLSLM